MIDLLCDEEKKKDFSLVPSTILEIDINGVKQIMENEKVSRSNIVSIWVEPPSLSELEDRLIERKTETKTEIAKRLEVTKEEMKTKQELNYLFDHSLINDQIEVCYKEIINIFIKEEIL